MTKALSHFVVTGDNLQQAIGLPLQQELMTGRIILIDINQ
jgi:hypothetical protein